MGRLVLVFVAAAVVTLVQAPAATGAGGWTWPVRGEVITAYSNDNSRPYAGGMHRGVDIAAAVGTPVVAVYGSTSPENTPPLAEHRELVWLELDCSPCHEKTCPLGHMNCLNTLGVDTVLAAVERLLAVKAAA